MVTASVVVTNFNGAGLLAQNLPAVLRASEFGEAAEVIVVDDGSTDNSRALIYDRFPQVRVVEQDQNLGFARAANAGIEASGTDVVVLLNSDMAPHPDFLPPLLAPFADSTVFAVMAQEIVPTSTGTICRSAPRAEFRRGFFHQVFETSAEPFKAPTVSFFASGGGSAFHRGKFLSLGGFDELFRPFYWEDVDLSMRAWRRGWRVLFEPSSLILHQESSTISNYWPETRVRTISACNAWLMVWKNALDRGLVVNHLAFALPALAWNLLRGNSYVLPGFAMAISRLPLARVRRQIEWKQRKLDDHTILALACRGSPALAAGTRDRGVSEIS